MRKRKKWGKEREGKWRKDGKEKGKGGKKRMVTIMTKTQTLY